MNVASIGNSIYAALKGDTASLNAIRAESKSLALSIATDPNASARVTSATVNGQSFTSTPTMTQLDRLKVLRWVCKCADNGGAISSVQGTSFT